MQVQIGKVYQSKIDKKKKVKVVSVSPDPGDPTRMRIQIKDLRTGRLTQPTSNSFERTYLLDQPAKAKIRKVKRDELDDFRRDLRAAEDLRRQVMDEFFKRWGLG